jgi:hypothetical protein
MTMSRPPASPAQHTARNIVVGAAGVVVVLAIIVGVIALTSGSGSSNTAASRSATSGSTVAASPSHSTVSSGSGHGAAAAVIERYFGYVNTKNMAAAQKLICTEQVDGWRKKITAQGGDFTLTIKSFAFASSKAGISAGSVDLTYNVTVRGSSTAHPVTFTTILQNGPKICGEQFG